MRVHVYTVCWNERLMLPYFLRHYEQFCERIIVYDNGSDDGSQEVVAAHPRAEMRPMESAGEFREDVNTHHKGRTWKESADRPDWIIACDVDELVYHPRMLDFLADCRRSGVTIPVPTGWQMVSDGFPTTAGQIYDAVQRGFLDPFYGKRAIFDPSAIEEMNYAAGCHQCYPEGRVVERRDPALKFLHFKFLGLDYVAERYAALGSRTGDYDRERGYCVQYAWSSEKLAQVFASYRTAAWRVPLDDGSREASL